MKKGARQLATSSSHVELRCRDGMGWLPAEMVITGPRTLPLVCTVMQDFWFAVTVVFLGFLTVALAAAALFWL